MTSSIAVSAEVVSLSERELQGQRLVSQGLPMRGVELQLPENSLLNNLDGAQPKPAEQLPGSQGPSVGELVRRHEDSGLRFPAVLDLPPAYDPS